MSEEPLPLTEEQIAAKWAELAPLIDKLNDRTDNHADVPVKPRSSLARDDEWADPYHLSHAVQACIVVGVDHLHAVKVLVVDARKLHVAAPASLVRGCLENLATAYWILHPAFPCRAGDPMPALAHAEREGPAPGARPFEPL